MNEQRSREGNGDLIFARGQYRQLHRLLLIGLKTGASFANQSQTGVSFTNLNVL